MKPYEENYWELNSRIEQYRQNWINHLERIPDASLPKQILFYKPKGKRPVGRPRKSWTDLTDQKNPILDERRRRFM